MNLSTYYEVELDFGDDAVSNPRRCDTLEDLNSYLQRVPDMLSFQFTGRVTVKIKIRFANTNQLQLTGLEADER